MEHQIVNWKTITEKSRNGRDFDSPLPHIIDCDNRGTLLSKLLAMPRQNPMAFADAVRLAGQKMTEADEIGYEKGQYFWYTTNFVEWISTLGYHIELTGDEFEPYVISAVVA